jgi:hypothetical protein
MVDVDEKEKKIDAKIRKLSWRIAVIKESHPNHPKLAVLRKERNRQYGLLKGIKESKLCEIMKFHIAQLGDEYEDPDAPSSTDLEVCNSLSGY